MKERPILFSAPMVRALLDGTKTQTRRVLANQWLYNLDEAGEREQLLRHCRYGQTGDQLWVREAWARTHVFGQEMTVYREGDNRSDYGGPWKPGIHMFRRDSRIDLEVTGVRIERLHDISQADARAEGAPPSHPSIDRISREFDYADFPRSWYAQLWEQINGASSWAANPWVWVVDFKRIKP